MPHMKRPHVASADQIRITRDGDYAVIEYADESVATTRLQLGAKKLASIGLPGGRVRTGETTRDALERELLEELGLR